MKAFITVYSDVRCLTVLKIYYTSISNLNSVCSPHLTAVMCYSVPIYIMSEINCLGFKVGNVYCMHICFCKKAFCDHYLSFLIHILSNTSVL